MSQKTPERGTQLGRFKMLEVIGDGEAAQVWRAEIIDGPGKGAQAAVKLIRPRLVSKDPDLMEQYVAEAGLSKALEHPNVVRVLDVGRSKGHYFIATEFVDGPNLKALSAAARRRGHAMPPEIALEIARQTCRGLGAALKARDPKGLPLYLLHLDVKPSNIFVDRSGVVKIADFSVMRAKSEMVHTDNIGLLTRAVRYMSPEQALGRDDLDTRADLFALCLVLYELMAGTPIYRGSAPGPLLIAAQEADIDGFADKLPDCPAFPRLVKFFYKGLAPNRTHRFASPGAMARGVVSVMKDLPDPELMAYVESLFPSPDAPREATPPEAEAAAPVPAPVAPAAPEMPLPTRPSEASPPVTPPTSPAPMPSAWSDPFFNPEESIGAEMDAWFDAEVSLSIEDAAAVEEAAATAEPPPPSQTPPQRHTTQQARPSSPPTPPEPEPRAQKRPKAIDSGGAADGDAKAPPSPTTAPAPTAAKGEEEPLKKTDYVVPTPRYRQAQLRQRSRFRPTSIAAVAIAVLLGGWVLFNASLKPDIAAPEPVRLDMSDGRKPPQRPVNSPAQAATDRTERQSKPESQGDAAGKAAPPPKSSKEVVYRAPEKNRAIPKPEGMISVRADPPGSVRIDGELKGRTPANDILLTAGKHMLTVKWLSGKSAKISVNVLAGKRLRCIARELPGTLECD